MHIDIWIQEIIFEVDGSYRDLYVHDVDLVVWEKLLELIKKSGWQPQLYKDGDEEEINNYSVRQILQEKKEFTFTLTIKFKGVNLNSHFFDEKELEFDISPKEISTQKKKNAVFEFMHFISKTFEKNVSILFSPVGDLDSTPLNPIQYY